MDRQLLICIQIMRILIIEDDIEQCKLLSYQLKKEGITTDTCYDGGDAEYYTEQNAYDLIILDNMLPTKDGLTVLRELRSKGNNVPVIMVTALGELNNRIDGLDHGADDYIVKPYDFKELMAHIRCRLRRSSYVNITDTLELADIVYDKTEHFIKGPLSECSVSSKEADLMELFFNNPDKSISRQMILARVWGADTEVEDGNIDNYIYFVRRRLKNVGSVVLLITIFLVVSGTPAIGEIGLTDFLFDTEWASTAAEPAYGILPFILTSVYGTFGAILIGVPLGILCAVFLAKIAGKRTASFVSGAVSLMSGIPVK